MIVKQVFSTSRLQSHKFILANIEQTVKMENKKRKENKRIQLEWENKGTLDFATNNVNVKIMTVHITICNYRTKRITHSLTH